MRIILKIQIILVLVIMGITLTKTAEAAYRKDASKYTYVTEGNGSCQGNTLVDKYDGFLDFCEGAVCTTVFNGNSGKNEVGCFIEVEESATPRPTVAPTARPTAAPTQAPNRPPGPAAPTPLCTRDFKYNECTACNRSWPVYTDSCTGAFSWGTEQEDKGCAHWCDQPAASQGPAASPNPVSDNPNPPANNPAPVNNNPVTAKYRVATSERNLHQAEWKNYTAGGVIVSAPSDIYLIDKTAGNSKAIFLQFLDSDGKFIKFSNGGEVGIEYISLENSVTGTAAIETSTTIHGVNKTWAQNTVKVDISGFQENNKTIIEVYFRNQLGSCDVNTCDFEGWTKIKSYGTNGFDQFSWTPKPGDVEPGIHMFGIFAVNAQGVADKILSVSPTNYIY